MDNGYYERQADRDLGIIREQKAEIERLTGRMAAKEAVIGELTAERDILRAALQRIKDNGERGGYAYGVAFAVSSK